jgi:hypothetical protein
MGVALPQGDIKTVYETISTDNYMGWKSCTMQEAQAAADKGTAAIGISEDRIVVLSANDEEQPVTQTASVMTLNENTSAYSVDGLEYYSYSYGTTTNNGNNSTLVLNKPYDPNYPYTLSGRPNNISAEQYYNLLSGYSHELRSDIVFDFTFDEIDSFRSYLVAAIYKNSTEQEKEQVVEDIFAVLNEGLSWLLTIKWPGLSAIFDAINTVVTINNINSDSVQDDIHDITDCVEKFTHNMLEGKSYPKSRYVTYTVSLLQQSPTGSWQIKIESSDGKSDIYTIHKEVYNTVLSAAITNAHHATIYKVAPEWTYYYE